MCLLTQDHFQHKGSLGILELLVWPLLSLRGHVSLAWGQGGGSESWAPFAARWVGDVPRLHCSRVTWSRAAPTYLWYWAQVRSKVKYLRVSCSTWDYLCAPAHSSIPLNGDPSMLCTSARSGFPRDGDGVHGPKGTCSMPHPLPTAVTWEARVWQFRYSLRPLLPPDSGYEEMWFTFHRHGSYSQNPDRQNRTPLWCTLFCRMLLPSFFYNSSDSSCLHTG